ncbi:MAG: hypothetical protein GWO11_02715, partial [Desulfuromonadales bacterium]|nr:hypothetical protein [Desulfuromonadales bacterium]NIR33385.1 hypothetical protein [Desulfuromonadales bacterium]NIS40963.1 hypothetical protein [Desulfuromonadales bacterium]
LPGILVVLGAVGMLRFAGLRFLLIAISFTVAALGALALFVWPPMGPAPPSVGADDGKARDTAVRSAPDLVAVELEVP